MSKFRYVRSSIPVFTGIKRSIDEQNILHISSNHEFCCKSIIIEVLSENNVKDEFFSGTINLYTVNCKGVSAYIYIDGKFVPDYNQVARLKSGTIEEGDCSVSCLVSCLDRIFTMSGIYTWACSAACATWETGLGLFICIFCVGGPALTCLEECCPGTVN
ncbi:hypothetical protein [Mangrovibacterium marinum]|uniref:hypothetical protein n=1 Tax=Mangrovibacterium marinum TaxID=1639118 RepID=UPI002A18DD91|nr:hypothetical protein [Mangrovibacterium marinum]